MGIRLNYLEAADFHPKDMTFGGVPIIVANDLAFPRHLKNLDRSF
jgi:hypothetical protein